MVAIAVYSFEGRLPSLPSLPGLPGLPALKSELQVGDPEDLGDMVDLVDVISLSRALASGRQSSPVRVQCPPRAGGDLRRPAAGNRPKTRGSCWRDGQGVTRRPPGSPPE